MLVNFEMAGVKIEVERKESNFEWNSFRNTFMVTISSNHGKIQVEKDFFGTKEITELTNEMFTTFLVELYESLFINSHAYDSFEEWCYDWGYDENDDDDKIVYEEQIKRGDRLNKIINQDWIDSIETYIRMADIKTN